VLPFNLKNLHSKIKLNFDKNKKCRVKKIPHQSSTINYQPEADPPLAGKVRD
jgi:hypothetical protein